ncbi:glyoxal oxidase N-terminus-domain-containing protein [Powellomyces hirtus]|nr:glyoxal oxidase N-terminus-domain-containing protein [Powellomyces hirtus]
MRVGLQRSNASSVAWLRTLVLVTACIHNVAAQGTWQVIGNTTLACIHAAYTAADRLFCMERPHVFPYPWNPYASGNPENKIYEGQETVLTGARVTSRNVDVPYVPFCAGHAMTADGGVFVAGGDMPYVAGFNQDGRNSLRTYKPCTSTLGSTTCGIGTWDVYKPMSSQRWYPTVTTLADGSFIIVGGSFSNKADLIEENNPTYEYFPVKTVGQWPRQLALLIEAFPAMLYPLVFQLPSGNIFIFANVMSILLDPRTEKITQLPQLPNAGLDHGPWSYPFTATGVLLPLRPSNNYTATVQICGGPKASQVDADGLPYASPVCMQIQPEAPTGAVWTRVDDMPAARMMPDVVILPDGGLLYTNGGAVGLAGGDAGTGRCYNPVFQTDIHYPTKPAGTQWSARVGTMTVPRLYHSEALLRYDGRVLTSGSDQQNYMDKWGLTGTGPRKPNCFPVGTDVCTDPFEYRIEQFTPPYLLTGVARPVIATSPLTVAHGQTFTITTTTPASEVTGVVMVRHASTTHSTNTDQRLVELVVSARTANSLTVVAPPNARIGIPGHYMLFLLKNGVPSVSKVVRLTVSGTSAPVGTCNSLAVDTFYQFGLNNLGLAASEDGTTTNYVHSNGRASFVPRDGSYFYENIADTCLDVSAYKYMIVVLNVAPGAAATTQLEFQFGCSRATIVRQTIPPITIPNTGRDVVFAIDLAAYFSAANLRQLRAFSLANFAPLNGKTWQIGNIQLVDNLANCRYWNAQIVRPGVVTPPTTTTSVAPPTATATPPATGCTKTAIDSFTRYGLNDAGLAASDDKTTTGYAVAGGVLQFLPKADGSSYFYENLNCLDTVARRFITFSIQTASTISFAVQLQTGCGAAGQRINGPAITGTFTQSTVIAIDTHSYLATAAPATTTLFSFVLVQMSTTTGTAPWQFTNLQTATALPCAFTNITLVTKDEVVKNWVNGTGSTPPGGPTCKRINVDTFGRYGLNDLGVLASDDKTMTTYTVANNQVTMVPKADRSSYWYEDINVGGVPYNAATVPNLVFTVQTAAPGAAFSLNIETQLTPTSPLARQTIATIVLGTALAKTYVVPLASYITAAQLQTVVAFGFNTFITDGTAPWIFRSVQLVSDATLCQVVNPTTVIPATPAPPSSITAAPTVPPGCTRRAVDTFGKLGTNDLGTAASDDATMTSFTVANNRLSMVPKADGSSYFYEDVAVGGAAYDASAAPHLVITVQSAAPAASFVVNVQVPSATAPQLTRITLATLTLGDATAKTFVINLANSLTPAQLKALVAFGFNTFKSDGAAPWVVSNLLLVSDATICQIPNAIQVAGPTVPAPTPAPLPGCTRVALDTFQKVGANDLGVAVSDDKTMTTFNVANGQLTVVPKQDRSSYWYEGLNVAGQPYSMTNVKNLVFTVQTTAAAASFAITVETPATAGTVTPLLRLPLATLVATTVPKTYVLNLANYLTPAQLAAVVAFGFNGFVTDGTAPWIFKDLHLVSDAATCQLTNPTIVPPPAGEGQAAPAPPTTTPSLPAGCKKLVVDTFARYGQNDMGVLASDDRTMTSYTVGNGQVAMVPKKDFSSYWYEDINVGALPYDISATRVLVFSMQAPATTTTAPAGVNVIVETPGAAGGIDRLTLATLTIPPSTAGLMKTYTLDLGVALTEPQLRGVIAVGWNMFVTDGTGTWVFRDVAFVSDVAGCAVGEHVGVVVNEAKRVRRHVDEF